MLILLRKLDQKINIGPDITVTVVEIRHGAVRLGIDAPLGFDILRDDAINREPKNRESIEEKSPHETT